MNTCATDPINRSTCEVMEREPVTFVIDTQASRPRVGRIVPDSVSRIDDGSPCGVSGGGVCEEGSRCESADGAMRVCVRYEHPAADASAPMPDGGVRVLDDAAVE